MKKIDFFYKVLSIMILAAELLVEIFSYVDYQITDKVFSQKNSKEVTKKCNDIKLAIARKVTGQYIINFTPNTLDYKTYLNLHKYEIFKFIKQVYGQSINKFSPFDKNSERNEKIKWKILSIELNRRLSVAITDEDISMIRFLISLDKIYNIDPTGLDNLNIRYAVQSNCPKIIEIIFNSKKYDKPFLDGTILILACATGKLKILKTIIALSRIYPERCKVDFSVDEYLPVIMAAGNNHMNIIKFILELKHGKYYDIDLAYNDNEIIKAAVLNGCREIFDLLIQYPEINPDIKELVKRVVISGNSNMGLHLLKYRIIQFYKLYKKIITISILSFLVLWLSIKIYSFMH
jgi:hypothetical protein